MSATTFGDEPFVTADTDLSIIDLVISTKDDMPFCCCSLNFLGRNMLFVVTFVFIAPGSIITTLSPK